MKDYIFKVLTSDDKIKFYTVIAENIKTARKIFAELSSGWVKGWCLLAVYHEV